jgi:hypothetical protein
MTFTPLTSTTESDLKSMSAKNKLNSVESAEKQEAASPITPDQPLVIDLPDGQKLVVGNMVAGSVIEVATWRGTGRPDSRTSRLMLGMSPGSITPTVVKAEEGPAAPQTPKDRFAALLNSLRSFPKNLFIKNQNSAAKPVAQKPEDVPSVSLSLKSAEPKSKKAHFLDFLIRSSHEQAKETQSKQDRVQEQVEIDQWLESIRAKSAASSKSAVPAKKKTTTATKSKKATSTSRTAKGK